MIEFEVPGPAVPKARARVYTVKTRDGRVFHRGVTPDKTVNYENWVKLCFNAKKPPDFVPYTSAVALSVRVFEAIPASFSKKRRKMALDGLIFPEKKPDVSNFLKSIEDSLNGLAWDDDKRVVLADIGKEYGEEPHATVMITPLTPQRT